MTSLFPRTTYAEDMPRSASRGIITSHVLLRAFSTGALAGAALPVISTPVRALLNRPAMLPLLGRVVRGAAIGSAVTSVFLAVALPLRISPDGDYGWQDRSWRLRENEQQVAMDWFVIAGATLGATSAGITKVATASYSAWRAVGGRTLLRGGWIRPLGLSGLGANAGMLAYIAWQASKSKEPAKQVGRELVEAEKGLGLRS